MDLFIPKTTISHLLSQTVRHKYFTLLVDRTYEQHPNVYKYRWPFLIYGLFTNDNKIDSRDTNTKSRKPLRQTPVTPYNRDETICKFYTTVYYPWVIFRQLTYLFPYAKVRKERLFIFFVFRNKPEDLSFPDELSS